MVAIKQITEIIIKCSLDSMKQQLSAMTREEKLHRLNGKLNPLELNEYNTFVENLEKLSTFDDEGLWDDKKQYFEDTVFEYEKRIFRGYDLNKYKNEIPFYDDDSFQSDEVKDYYDESISELEQLQIDNQEALTSFQTDCFCAYFDNESLNINGELNNSRHWNMLEGIEQRVASVMNKQYRRGIDAGMNKNEGLLQNTKLYHGSSKSKIISIHTRVGEKVKFDGYVSTSFNYNVGEAYQGDKGFLVEFLAPQGTKGFCANDSRYDRLTNYRYEHEYLLGRGNTGRVVDIDYEHRTCKVLLDG